MAGAEIGPCVLAFCCLLAVLAGMEVGYASWYGPGFYGQTMANGEVFDGENWCIAHKTLPLDSWVWLLGEGKALLVRVCDRGPYGPDDWIVDVSPAVAERLWGRERFGVTDEGIGYGGGPVLLIPLAAVGAGPGERAGQTLMNVGERGEYGTKENDGGWGWGHGR